jgi:hypothetical protein
VVPPAFAVAQISNLRYNLGCAITGAPGPLTAAQFAPTPARAT